MYSTNHNFVAYNLSSLLPKRDCTDEKLRSWYMEADNHIIDACLQTCKNGGYRYMFFIPAEWLDALGHTDDTIKRWLETIKFTGIWDFSYRYYGRRSISIGQATCASKYREYSSQAHAYVPTLVGHEKNEYYVIGYLAKSSSFEAYLQMIALRYLYNVYYTDIPESVFKILDSTDLTPWEAFILAHSKRKYYYYYSIMNQLTQNSSEHNVVCENNVLNPFLEVIPTIKTSLQNDMIAGGMTYAFNRSLGTKTVDLEKARELFTAEKFTDLVEYMKSVV